MRIWLRGTGEIYPEKYEWGKPEFWIDEVTKILSSRGLKLEDFKGISEVYIGSCSEPYTTIRFNNGIEIYAENQSPLWAIDENDMILNKLK